MRHSVDLELAQCWRQATGDTETPLSPVGVSPEAGDLLVATREEWSQVGVTMAASCTHCCPGRPRVFSF